MLVARCKGEINDRLKFWLLMFGFMSEEKESFIYLLLTECVVRTVSYGPSFFPRLRAWAIKRGGREQDP